MREIKFRAWDLAEEEMLSENDLDNRIVETGEDGYFHFLKVARYIPLQYTGLKDKNGVEIYDGDIYHMGDPKITYTVIWQDTGFKGKQNSSTSFAGLLSWQEKIEVIGNIHEHSHLLKTKK